MDEMAIPEAAWPSEQRIQPLREGSPSQFLGVVISQSVGRALGAPLIPHCIIEPIRQRQAAVHLIPEQLAPFSRDREGTVVQIPAQIAQGIADAAPVVWAEIRLGFCHLPILTSTRTWVRSLMDPLGDLLAPRQS